MVIELRGVEFHNKGAELMLMAALEQIRKEIPEAIITMESKPSVTVRQQREHGIYTKSTYNKYGINLGNLAIIIPKFLRRKKRLILEKEIDVIIDGSGYAFGDIWGARKAGYRMADHIEMWKKSGKKVILLPQAFGPFKDSELGKKMNTIVDLADIIFARDKYSFSYLKELSSEANNIDLKPDFTNLIQGAVPNYFNKTTNYITIIPNNKLLETKVFNKREEYLDLLSLLVEKIRLKGFVPLFLIHEGKKDLMLAEEVNTRFNGSIDIVKEDDPLLIKGIIGSSFGVITSRFHGLVSALSQAIPCLCLGWSHKYEALLEDYGYISALMKKEDWTGSSLDYKIDLITNESSREDIKENLSKTSLEQKKLSSAMWKKVFDIIKQ